MEIDENQLCAIVEVIDDGHCLQDKDVPKLFFSKIKLRVIGSVRI